MAKFLQIWSHWVYDPPPLFTFSYLLLFRRSGKFVPLCRVQCDQKTRLFFNIWPFTTIPTLPSSIKICPMQLQKIAKFNLTLKDIVKRFLNFSEVVKSKQIWSHSSCLVSPSYTQHSRLLYDEGLVRYSSVGTTNLQSKIVSNTMVHPEILWWLQFTTNFDKLHQLFSSCKIGNVINVSFTD